MDHIILVNPYAGRRNNAKKAIIIQKLLKKSSINSVIITSKYPGHLKNIVEKMTKDTKCRFYCIGGDGTINEVATGLINTNSEMVIIPYGTGNDFFKVISRHRSLRKIIEFSLKNSTTSSDIIKFNKNKFSINILSIGFDAMVGGNIDKFRWIPLLSGKAKYNLSILYTLFFNRNFKLKVRCDDKIFKGKYTLIAISNGKYYGGGVCPSRDANISDGLLDICIVSETNIFTKLLLLPKYKKGKHENLKQVTMIKAKEINIVSTKNFPINVDGEVSYTNKLKAGIQKNSVNVVKT